ncbi:hypothetical protein Tco_0936313 [Tanacetum coccineum]
MRKTNQSPRSCLRWQPTGRILKTVCLRWVPTGKTFASSTTKVESEPPNGSNADIPNQCESEQALNVSASTLLSTADQASVFMAMMSDHNSSDLVPQRQEMSVENVSSGLVPQGQKASDYDNSDPVPPRQNVVPTAEKTDSSQQGLEFLFSPLLEEYYNPTHGLAEENNNDQAPNASFQEAEFINPFCTRVQEIGESSSRNIDNTDGHSFQPQSHDYRWTRDHPLEQVRGNPTMPVQTRRQLATDPEMCMFALTVSIVEPKKHSGGNADSAWIESNAGRTSIISTRLKILWNSDDKPFVKMVIKLRGYGRTKMMKDQTGNSQQSTTYARHGHDALILVKALPEGYSSLVDKLVSYDVKEIKTALAMSLADAEYLALSAICAQVMWNDDTQLQDYEAYQLQQNTVV